ncbi:hypothetical protein [Streptomyces sp. NPDC101393]|uniref:hypothetical protein n=1 Tax=Streptomyces sp. NPDC101393 TaxID=3366141 RepID=UPI003818AF64
MARYAGKDDPAVYRAVITETYEDGRTFTSHMGPYTVKNPATAAITRAKDKAERDRASVERGGWGTVRTVEGYVEKSVLDWRKLS